MLAGPLPVVFAVGGDRVNDAGVPVRLVDRRRELDAQPLFTAVRALERQAR
jgi:hypothetical protein